MSGKNTGVRDALVVLHHVEIRSGGLGRLHFYNEREAPAGSIYAKTNPNGICVLSFFWEPLQLGNVADTEEPKYQLNILAPDIHEGYSPAIIYEGRLTFVVSLRAVADGRIPDPRSATSMATSIVRQAYKYSRGVPIPRLFLSPGRPSAEYYALLGAAEVQL